MKAYSNRHIWQITYPILISLLMENMIGLTDTAFLGRVGEVELGASALAGVYYMAIFMLGFGFSIGVQILIARRNGEGRLREIGPIFQQGLLFLLFFAAVMFFVSKSFTPLLLRRLIDSDAVYTAAISYLDWRIYGFFFSFAAVLFRAFYVGTTNTRILTANSVVMVLTNVVLNYILIFGKLGCPALGIAGAAIASSAAELVSLLFFAIYTRLKGNPRRYRLFRFRGVNFRELGLIFNVSIWTMMQAFISTATWFLFFLAVEHLGERQLAISNIVRSLSSILFVTISAFGSTTSALVSTLMGRGEPKLVMPTVWQIVRMSYWAALPVMALMALFPSLVLHIYTGDQSLISASIASLWVMVAIYFTLIPSNMLFCAVSGTGNTRAAMLMELVALAVYVAAIWQIIIVHRPDIAVCWTVDHIYSIVLLLFTYLYLTEANWQNKKI